LTYKPLPEQITEGSPHDGQQQDLDVRTVLLWDRKAEGGFPETKVLKQRVRDHIEPKKDLGHSDVGGKKNKSVESQPEESTEELPLEKGQKKLEDCETCP